MSSVRAGGCRLTFCTSVPSDVGARAAACIRTQCTSLISECSTMLHCIDSFVCSASQFRRIAFSKSFLPFSFAVVRSLQLKAKNKRLLRSFVPFFVHFSHRLCPAEHFSRWPVEYSNGCLCARSTGCGRSLLSRVLRCIFSESDNSAIDSNSRLQFINVVYLQSVVIFPSSPSLLLPSKAIHIQPHFFNVLLSSCGAFLCFVV